jgi:hypothetical protein
MNPHDPKPLAGVDPNVKKSAFIPEWPILDKI